ncbi:hypothetical protein RRG08_054269 [Elysia crispata]|uniref:Uncharacterized protein n=1 Tax=Elysia crispata TaxID=231223 RepID=A0AAE1CW76_9GAST|nr:hypothetical protein RRG08_054269 [Elysia crispata]
MVIKRTMRFYTPVHFFHRVLSKDTVINGKIALAGTAVSCELYNLHHNPLLYGKSPSRELYTQLNLLLAVQDKYPGVQVALVYKKISDPFKVISDRFK